MEEKLKDLLKHIKENTTYLYPKDVSNDVLLQNLMSRGIQFVHNPTDQSTVDLCTLVLVLSLRRKNENK